MHSDPDPDALRKFCGETLVDITPVPHPVSAHATSFIASLTANYAELPTPKHFRFAGIWVPLITPFNDGRVDIPALQRLTRQLIAQGVHGLVVCGTTAEAAQLDEAEQISVLETVMGIAGYTCPVAFGISGSNTLDFIRKVKQYNQYAIAGFLVSAPSYVKPSQQGIFLHFQAIAAASQHPIIVYNIASRTGVNIELASLIALATDPKIAGIKESSGNLQQVMDTVNETGLAVLSGDDALLLNTLCCGGTGAMSAAAHIRPDLYVQLYHLVRTGRNTEARQLFNALLPFIRLLFEEPNPAPLKAVLAMQGLISEDLRLPMTPVSMQHRQKLKAALEIVMALKIKLCRLEWLFPSLPHYHCTRKAK